MSTEEIVTGVKVVDGGVVSTPSLEGVIDEVDYYGVSVQELVNILLTMPPNARVVMDGCGGYECQATTLSTAWAPGEKLYLVGFLKNWDSDAVPYRDPDVREPAVALSA